MNSNIIPYQKIQLNSQTFLNKLIPILQENQKRLKPKSLIQERLVPVALPASVTSQNNLYPPLAGKPTKVLLPLLPILSIWMNTSIQTMC
jgi:hypothetical protein